MGVIDSGYSKEEIKRLIYEELPKIIREHPEVRVELWNVLTGVFAPKEETEDRFEKLLKEIQKQREEANKRFEEHDKRFNALWSEVRALREEANRRFEEHDRKFNTLWAEVRALREDSNRKFEEMLNEIRRVDRRIDRTIGALGARWGISTEHTFREAMRSVIEDITGLKVERYLKYDTEGKVFGRPDQVELDLVIHDGMVWIMEIKSSISKPEVYAFFRKVEFYREKEGKEVKRRIIVSPMIEPSAMDVIKDLSIEYFTYPEDMNQRASNS